jgi:hypothetical protein
VYRTTKQQQKTGREGNTQAKKKNCGGREARRVAHTTHANNNNNDARQEAPRWGDLYFPSLWLSPPVTLCQANKQASEKKKNEDDNKRHISWKAKKKDTRLPPSFHLSTIKEKEEEDGGGGGGQTQVCDLNTSFYTQNPLLPSLCSYHSVSAALPTSSEEEERTERTSCPTFFFLRVALTVEL